MILERESSGVFCCVEKETMQFLFDVTAFVVALSILFATVMWATVWIVKFQVPIWDLAKIFMTAFGLQLLIYILFSFWLVDIQLRAQLVRVSIIVICQSQAIPLLFTYKAWKHGTQ